VSNNTRQFLLCCMYDIKRNYVPDNTTKERSLFSFTVRHRVSNVSWRSCGSTPRNNNQYWLDNRRTSIFSSIKLTIVQNDHCPSACTILRFSIENLLPSWQLHCNPSCWQQIPWFPTISQHSTASGYIKMLVAM